MTTLKNQRCPTKQNMEISGEGAAQTTKLENLDGRIRFLLLSSKSNLNRFLIRSIEVTKEAVNQGYRFKS